MADEALDVKEEATVVPDDTTDATTDSSTEERQAEKQSPEAEEFDDGEHVSSDLDKEDSEEETKEDSKDDSKEESEEESKEEQPQSKADQRKEQLNNEIRELANQKRSLKEEVERLNSEVYKPQTEDELIQQINPETGNYYNRIEAKLAAMEQQQQMQQYNEQVADTQLSLSHEAQRALEEFPMFDSESPEYNPQVAAQVDQILGASLVKDPNTGQIVGSNISPYQLYKTVADSARASATEGQIKGQRATEQMLAAADGPSGAQQGEPSFTELSTHEMEEKLRKQGHDI